MLLRLTAASSTICTGILLQFMQKMHHSETTTLAVSNKEMKDIMKRVKFPEDSDILLKVSLEQLKMKIRTKVWISIMLLCALVAILLEHSLR